MYGFVDTVPGSGTGSTSLLSLRTIFNSIDLDEELTDDVGLFTTLSITGRSSATQRINSFSVPGMDGAHEENDPAMESREIGVKFRIKDKTNEGFRNRLNRLNSLLEGTKQILEFTDEKAIFYATLSRLELPEEESNDLIGTMVFYCSDPYKYGPELEAVFPGDYVTVTNSGTAESEPTFILQPTQPVTFALIQNQENEYMMIGKPADVEETVVDERTTYFTERGETLDAWDSTPVSPSSGSFTTTGDAIVVNSWGTGNAWHGPVLMREIDATQDFEVEMYVYIRTDQPTRTFMTSFNLFDEGLNELAMMRVWDKTTNQVRKVAEARVGPYIDTYQNYLIDDRNYNIQGQRVWGGILRLRRVGNEFEFYVARVTQGGRHTHAIKQTFTDNTGDYAGRLKYVQFDIKNYGSTQTPNEIRVEYIKVTKLNKATVDQTPYIAYPGDEIIFDHKSEEILINGEDATSLKQFGASYFNLEKGANELIVQPSNSFGVGLKYREKFK